MKSKHCVQLATRLLIAGVSQLALFGCASQAVVATCPELPVPPPELTAPIPPKEYLCLLGKILDQDLCLAT